MSERPSISWKTSGKTPESATGGCDISSSSTSSSSLKRLTSSGCWIPTIRSSTISSIRSRGVAMSSTTGFGGIRSEGSGYFRGRPRFRRWLVLSGRRSSIPCFSTCSSTCSILHRSSASDSSSSSGCSSTDARTSGTLPLSWICDNKQTNSCFQSTIQSIPELLIK